MKSAIQIQRSFYLALLFLLSSTLIGTFTLADVYGASLGAKKNTHQKISAVKGGLGDILNEGSRFGGAVVSLGDLNQDGVIDMAVGAPGYSHAEENSEKGAVWILFLNRKGKVKAKQMISATTGGFNGDLSETAFFGSALANVGDLDGDGVPDLAVGTPFDNDGGPGRGAVWILFLNPDGTVKTEQKISAVAGGFGGNLEDEDFFGSALTHLGDLDMDGVLDLAVGASGEGESQGAIWILFLNPDGTVKAEQRISAVAGGFRGGLQAFDQLGQSLANLGDVNRDGIPDLAAGVSRLESEESNIQGAVWILFMKRNGKVKRQQEISTLSGRLGKGPSRGARFGSALSGLGNYDGKGAPDLVVGSHGNSDDSKAKNKGAAWILNLKRSGIAKKMKKVKPNIAKFEKNLAKDSQFGWSIANLGDLNGDGVVDLAIGAPGDDDGGADKGAVWIVFLK